MPPSIDRPTASDPHVVPHPGARYRLVTLGKPAVYATTPFGDLVPRSAIQLKHLATLALIALSPRRTASRQVIAGYLWGETKDRDPRHGLRGSINRLRSDECLGPDALTSGDKESITLLADMTVDCEEFERLIGEGRYTDALSLYGGRFFADWSVPGAEGFEDWANGKRQHYASLFAAASTAAAQELLDRGQAAAAARVAERLRDETPAVSEHWRLLLECRIAARDRIHALADASRLEQLERDGEIELDNSLRGLVRRAQTSTPDAGAAKDAHEHPPLTPEMVGREREFSLLVYAWERAEAGRCVRAHVESPAGFGKTRLLEEFASRLRSLHARPAAVVAIRADIVHRAIDYGVAARLAHALGQMRGASGVSGTTASVLIGLEPSLADVFTAATALLPPAHDAIRMRASALGALAAAVAAERRLAILVDDFHWADSASRQVLAAAFSGLHAVPLLVVTSARTDDGSELSADVKVTLPALARDAIRELCRSIAELPEAPWADSLVDGLVDGARGSPFLVLQALALVIESGTMRITDGEWECTDPVALRSHLEGTGVVAARIAALTSDEQFALLIVAFSAGSLSADALSTALTNAGRSETALRRLEERGLVERIGGTLRPAHDELVEQAQHEVGFDMVARAHLAIADMLTARSSGDPETLRIVGVHLRAAGDVERAHSAFERFVRSHRGRGDRRTAYALAREFLGTAFPDQMRAFVRRLPFRLRHPHVARDLATAAGAAAVLMLSLITYRATRDAPPPAYFWTLLGDERGISAAESVGVQPERVGTTGQIEIGNHPQIHLDRLQPGLTEWAINPQSSRRWAASAAVGDSGTTDLFLIENGRVRRLTFAHGDDVTPSWSPDGRQIVFASARWSQYGSTSIAIIDDPLTGDARRLASSTDDAYDRIPVWSQDGTRIAFLRDTRQRPVTAVSMATVDGRDQRCMPLGQGRRVDGAPEWINQNAVRVRVLDSTNMARDATVTTNGQITFGAPSAPDRWTVAAGTQFQFQQSSKDPRSFLVTLRDEPQRAGVFHLTPAWRQPSWPLMAETPRAHPYLDTLLVAAISSPAVGIPHRLAAVGRDNFGEPIDAVALRWTLLGDSSHARLSSDGILDAAAPGRYRVRVTAGGWRTVDATIAVAIPRRDSTIASEVWTGDVWRRWRRFGDPFPIIDSGGRALTLNINGDGSFFSGMYTPPILDVTSGGGIDVLVSTPITLGQDQTILFGLSAATDSANLAQWDHRVGWPHIANTGDCSFHFPGGPEGDHRADFIGAGHDPNIVRAPARLRTGRPFRVRLQILPDGRCITALDGVVIAVSPVSVHPNERRRVFIYGNTRDTKIRVVSLEVFTGVRRDIALDTTWHR